MANRPIPNLFLAGVPKAGTTAMYSYLKEHPEIYMSPIKEPGFFAEDVLGHQRKVVTLEKYRNCFEAASNARVIGEASTAYMVSRKAAENIRRYSPDARIVVMLRDPVDVMHALHSDRMFANMEHVRDFETAVDSREQRFWRAGPWAGQEIIRPSYREVASFAPQLKRYFDIFGEARVHVVVYDDFRRDPAAAYANTLAFLDIHEQPNLNLVPHNANRRARSGAVQDYLRYPPSVIRQLARLLLPAKTRRGLGTLLRRMNVVEQPRVPMDARVRQRLQFECSADIEELSRLTGRDLSAWLRTAEGVGEAALTLPAA